ncbi:cytochrome b/b6 domain-containing protein [Thiohalobacter sp. IOR34]|uniref:cytochrome b/b6 domain-containing protein n=1 Tax=Thiohalobacter sp. IOR34 TaxID=3057176 RepID=UPI0025B02EEC|nr:cytochrome b/b6 domain-containing protein [Thiohalobacter sp. IOR34]WJW74999.1 cytochrome b/b6 domain-containing protein [Thiohalobacter sp. IOR34]
MIRTCLRFLSLLLLLCGLAGWAAAAPAIDDAECLECHGVKGFAVPEGAHGGGRKRSLDLNYEAMQESRHGELACVECHSDVERLPHEDELAKVDCVSCHVRLDPQQIRERVKPKGRAITRRVKTPPVVVQTEAYTHSIHAERAEGGLVDNADCADCHTAHYVFSSSDPRASTYRENSPQMCGGCHQDALAEYGQSVHGAAIRTPWKGDSATCSDCHSSHQVSEVKGLSAHRIVTKNCGNCHEKAVTSYMTTTHGALAWLGNEKVARCVDCHRGHDTRRIDDPLSLVSGQNRLETCRECHEDASDKIVQYKPHGNTSDFEKYPAMFITGKFMVGIVIGVLIFFYGHSLLWFYREYKSRVIKWYRGGGGISVPYREKPERKHSDKQFQRFPWYWRLNHWALALSVMTLVLTGMAVMYPDTDWAMRAIEAVGGSATFGLIHRTAGSIFLLSVFGHGGVVLARVLRDKDFDWFGPNSLLPRRKDWEDMKGQFRWFFGKGRQPRFDRWTYWEKFDYWAVYWGAFVIGSSGLLLWFSPVTLKYLPGWVFNVASIAHGVEAFLAVATLFVVHFFNNHFRPAKFPLDTVMFTGSWDLEEFKEERPEEYARLVASGELEKHLVDPPSKLANFVFHVIGFTLLAVGIILLIMVLVGFSQRGLV